MRKKLYALVGAFHWITIRVSLQKRPSIGFQTLMRLSHHTPRARGAFAHAKTRVALAQDHLIWDPTHHNTTEKS